MHRIIKWTTAAAAAALVASCQSAPPLKVAEAPTAPASTGLPYLWTTGEAPQAYKDIHEVMAAQEDLVEVLGSFWPGVVRMDD